MINQISIKTKFGWISAYETSGKIFKIQFGKLKKQKKSKILKKFRKNLFQFLNNRKKNIEIPYKTNGNLIQKKIWSELKKIKKGHTKSYGEIANKFKLNPRHVGKICSQNKLLLLIPCHRVIRKDGTLGGFTSLGGLKLKRKILEFEKKWNF
tara:strand:- start:929 stop:1384 length:456 start_codon:yes stop_codon:yes gene_type:complete